MECRLGTRHDRGNNNDQGLVDEGRNSTIQCLVDRGLPNDSKGFIRHKDRFRLVILVVIDQTND